MNAVKVVIIMGLLATNGCQTGEYERGLDAAKKGDFDTAVQIWTPLATNGDARAQYDLGGVYYQVFNDFTTAAKWLEMAAEQGHVRAQNNLGNLYKSGKGVKKDLAVALKWFLRASERGHATAILSAAFLQEENGELRQSLVLFEAFSRGESELNVRVRRILDGQGNNEEKVKSIKDLILDADDQYETNPPSVITA